MFSKMMYVKHLYTGGTQHLSLHSSLTQEGSLFGKAHVPIFLNSLRICLWSMPRKINLRVTFVYYPKWYYWSALFLWTWQWIALSWFPKSNSLWANEDLTPIMMLWRTCWGSGGIPETYIARHHCICRLLFERRQQTSGSHGTGVFIL